MPLSPITYYCPACPYLGLAHADETTVEIAGMAIEVTQSPKPRYLNRSERYLQGKNVYVEFQLGDNFCAYLELISDQLAQKPCHVITSIISEWYSRSTDLEPSCERFMRLIRRGGVKRIKKVGGTIYNKAYGFLASNASRLGCKDSELARAIVEDWMINRGVV